MRHTKCNKNYMSEWEPLSFRMERYVSSHNRSWKINILYIIFHTLQTLSSRSSFNLTKTINQSLRNGSLPKVETMNHSATTCSTSGPPVCYLKQYLIVSFTLWLATVSPRRSCLFISVEDVKFSSFIKAILRMFFAAQTVLTLSSSKSFEF